MYPLRGELQDLGRHHGLRVEMAGVGNVLEGRSRRESESGHSLGTLPHPSQVADQSRSAVFHWSRNNLHQAVQCCGGEFRPLGTSGSLKPFSRITHTLGKRTSNKLSSYDCVRSEATNGTDNSQCSLICYSLIHMPPMLTLCALLEIRSHH